MATARKTKPALPDPHDSDPCPAPRLEGFTALRPGGEPATIVRCQECGAQTTK